MGASAAGMEAAPGRVSPSTSAMVVIVEAVPIVMQVPGERAIRFHVIPLLFGNIAGFLLGLVFPDV